MNISEEEVQGEGCYVKSPHKMAIFMMFCSGIGVGVFGVFLIQMYIKSYKESYHFPWLKLLFCVDHDRNRQWFYSQY